jgi:hypothetical protein
MNWGNIWGNIFAENTAGDRGERKQTKAEKCLCDRQITADRGKEQNTKKRYK